MKRTIEKTVVILLVATFIISSLLVSPVLVLPAKCQPVEHACFSVTQGNSTYLVEPIHGNMPAVDFYNYSLETWHVPTNASLFIMPNPVGVGQTINVYSRLDPLPPPGDAYHNLTIRIVKPDGSVTIVGPYGTPSGWTLYQYIAQMVGNYSFRLQYPGEVYQNGGFVYLPSNSTPQIIMVTPEPQPPPGNPNPAPFVLPPTRSGYSPFMEARKSKIYLYEYNGALSLMVHSLKGGTPYVNFGMNMTIGGLPSGAYIDLSDDPGEFRWPTGTENPDWVIGAWTMTIHNDSEGGIISGLENKDWTITVYAGAAGDVDAWEWQTATGAIPLRLLMYGQPGPIVPVVISNNLLVNPGFENGLNGWNKSQGTAVYSVDNTTVHSGAFSCKGVETDTGSLGRLYQDVTNKTSPGYTCQISGWIETEGVTGSVVIGLDYVDANGATPEDGYVSEIGYISGTTDGWMFFQSEMFTLPPMPDDARALWFLFDFNSGAGTAWLDDVSLTAAGGIGVITVNNVVQGVPPDSNWNYLITDPTSTTVYENFTLPAGGGTVRLTDPVFLYGGQFLVTETPKFGYSNTNVAAQIYGSGNSSVSQLQALLDLGQNAYAVVTFTNAPASGAFALAKLGDLIPVDWFYNIPPRQPVPIQSACPIDINKDGKPDLVLGKPMAILVNLTGLPAADGQVSVKFDTGAYYTMPVTAANITGKSVISFYPIVPSSAGLTKTITGNYTLGTSTGSLMSTTVSVKATKDLTLYFVWMDNSAYGHVSEQTFKENVGNVTAFINATYPVKNVTVYATYAGKSVTGTSGPFSSLAAGKTAIESDCTLVKNALSKYSLTASATTIGIGICPNNTAVSGQPDYFSVKGTAKSNYSGAVGFSKGPGTKGVVMLEGYYGAGAHEVAHTFKLYYAVPEQYQGLPWNVTGGMPSNGVWVQQGQWRTGISFMGLIEKGTLNTTWEDNVYTYYWLFRNLTVTAGDPEIVQANGLIYKNGTVELTSDWYHTMGTPDATDPGAFSLKFLDANNQTLNETSFNAQFFDNIDPGVSMGQNIKEDPKFGTIDSDTASFGFAAEYPAGTASVQIINNTDPAHPVVMETVNATDIISLQPIVTKAYFTDSDFNPINSFDCLFTPSCSGYYKMSATNPATFYYTLQIKNNNPTGLFTIRVNVPSDFDLKPLSPRTSPVQIDGTAVTYSISAGGVLKVPNIKINQYQMVTLTVHLDYALVDDSQQFPSSAQTTYSKAYAFSATLDSTQAETASITAAGKKVTAIGGFIADLLCKPKGGLTVTLTKSGSVVRTDISPSDGFYFIAVPAGTYTIKISDAFGTLLAQAKDIKVTQDQFVKKDFLLLLSTLDSSISGFVKDDSGNGVPGVTVKLLKSGTVMATTTTDLGGYYVFRSFLMGQFTVQITVPQGYTATTTSKTIWISLFETEIVNFNLTHVGP